MPKFTGRQQQTIRRKRGGGSKGIISLSTVVVIALVGMVCIYAAFMISLSRYSALTAAGANHNNNVNPSNNLRYKESPNPKRPAQVYTRDQWADRTPSIAKSHKEWGEGVEPQILVSHKRPPEDATDVDNHHEAPIPENKLTLYMEEVDQNSWNVKPLPKRTSRAEDLEKVEYPEVNSCSKLPEQWPVDQFPDKDPFLPWLHDVFATSDGKFIQFVAQNKRRCRTGTTPPDQETLKHMQPQASLFQHVAVKRVDGDKETRYRLSSHEEADEDGMVTRFICRFKPSGKETLSVYNTNYEFASYRKRHRRMFSPEGRDNKFIHTTQLIFQCPVPEDLVETIRSGSSVVDDYATLFVDIVPIRTPPRYGPPNQFFPPYYKEFQLEESAADVFDADIEWGKDHILPRIDDSGRWENIPICKPSLQTYGKEKELIDEPGADPSIPQKKHKLISCLWSSTGYATRGNRFAINDGQRRLLEWISYNKLIGVEHFYLYDNSAAFGTETSLKPIADLFPEEVTYITWPSKVCNNNPNNVDSVGERSSQYAAESSCRLRFGPHTDWLLQLDIDEYLVPMGDHKSIHPVLDKLDEEGNKIISFGSWRAWPRRRFIEDPVKLHGVNDCGRDRDCFQLRIPMNYTIFQAYNCDRQKPGQKKSKMPAEKQIYRPDYVKQHFIHYSTITELSEMNREDLEKIGREYKPKGAFPDPLSRFGNEETEGLMLHTKAVATQDTIDWETVCKATYEGHNLCRLGNPFPPGIEDEDVLKKGDKNGLSYNCYINSKIDDYWVPLLESSLEEKIPELHERRQTTYHYT